MISIVNLVSLFSVLFFMRFLITVTPLVSNCRRVFTLFFLKIFVDSLSFSFLPPLQFIRLSLFFFFFFLVLQGGTQLDAGAKSQTDRLSAH